MKLNSFTVMLDKLWRRAVILVYGPDCQICGARAGEVIVDSAHIIGRGNWWTRWLVKNSVRACQEKCHKHHIIIAWLKEADSVRYEWVLQQKREIHQDRELDLKVIKRELMISMDAL